MLRPQVPDHGADIASNCGSLQAWVGIRNVIITVNEPAAGRAIRG